MTQAVRNPLDSVYTSILIVEGKNIYINLMAGTVITRGRGNVLSIKVPD